MFGFRSTAINGNTVNSDDNTTSGKHFIKFADDHKELIMTVRHGMSNH